MAPYHEQINLDKGVKAYMALIAKKRSLRFDKKIVRSDEFKDFLYHLARRSPFALQKLLEKVSRSCTDALRRERHARKDKKRAASVKCDARNIKRHKTSNTVTEKTLQPAETYDDGETSLKNENPSPQSNTYFTDRALLNTLVSSMPSEDGSEASIVPETLASNIAQEGGSETPIVPQTLASNIAQEGGSETPIVPETLASNIAQEGGSETSVVPSRYEIESGLMMRSPTMEAHVKASLFALKPSTERSNFDIEKEIANAWKILHFLDFYKTRHDLEQHLENRENTPEEKLYSRAIWSSSDPGEILDTLESVGMSNLDNKIHRAYGQTLLVLSVDAEVARGCETIIGHRSDHMSIFEGLACKKAGSVSNAELAQIASSYFYEYQSGQRWLAVIEWFGGSGIVLIFIIAGIGTWYMKSWTEFQRSCVQHIAGLLHSIRGLVETLGPDALERYCRQGRLGNNCLDRLKPALFTEPDTNEGPGLVDPEIEDAVEETGEEPGSEDMDDGSDDEDEECGDADEEDECEDEEEANEHGGYQKPEVESEDDFE